MIHSASSLWRTRLQFLAGLVAAVLAVRAQAKGNTDFDIYLTAAREMVNGSGLDLYRPHADTGAYPYPHVFLLPIAALDGMLPSAWLRVLWALGLGVCFTLICRDLDRVSRKLVQPRCALWILWVTFFALFVRFFSTNFTHNQLSIWIGWFVLSGAVAIAQDRSWRGGVLLGAAAALKLTPILFLGLLPMMGRFRGAMVMGATVLLLVFLVPLPFLGMAEHTRHLQQMYDAIITRAVPQEEVGATAFELGRSGSLYGTWHYVLQGGIDEGVTFASLSAQTVQWILNLLRLALLALLAWGFLRATRKEQASATSIALHRLALGMLAMALFAPLTRTYHLAAAALPALLFVWSAPWTRHHSVQTEPNQQPGAPRWLWYATAVCLAFAMTLRQKSMLGRELWLALDQAGTLHFGLLGMTLWLCWNGPSRSESPPPPTPHEPLTQPS